MSVYMVAQGRFTQSQLDEAVRHLHNQVCSAFDGGEANRLIQAGPVTPTDRISHESQVVSVIWALEKAGFKVLSPTTQPPSSESGMDPREFKEDE